MLTRLFSSALLAGFLALPLAGCAAVYTALVQADLSVSTRMSDTIFLDPRNVNERTVYVEVRNTSAKRDLVIQPRIAADIASRGYRVVDDPDEATFWLQANILYVGEVDLTAAESVLDDGYGGSITSAILTGAAGTAAVLATGEDSEGFAEAVGVAVGVGSFLADILVSDVTFSIVADIRLSERTRDAVQTRETLNLREGAGGISTQRSSSRGDRKSYEARVLTTARQVNLEFDDAKDEMESSLVSAISGLF